MTAETLKPFITPTSATGTFPVMQSNVSHAKQKSKLYAVGFGITVLALGIILLSLVIIQIWNSTRVTHLQTELTNLKQVVENLHHRLGINYLEDVENFEKEYEKALIDDPYIEDTMTDNDNDMDEDVDDTGSEEYAYDSSESAVQGETDTSLASSDDNVFADFKNYSDAKKKGERKSRSIDTVPDALQSAENQTESEQQASAPQGRRRRQRLQPGGFVAEHADQPRPGTPVRRRNARRRHLAIVNRAKSSSFGQGDTRLAAATPAAHFHLNRKVSHHNAGIRVDSYRGDMYIGHVTATSDNSWQQHFSVEHGVLTVHEPGLYYVYAQICYNNAHDQNGFIIFHGHTPFLQCLNTVPTNMPQKVHTCHTSGLIQLQEQETIHLRDIHSDRSVMLKDDNNRSYFGLIKV